MINFRHNVYEIVKTIPIGRVITYKHIGNKLKSKAHQAIGQALKNNPDPINIACHRIIKSNREIGGYFGHINDNINK
jgi:methylated-DNA-[protein]-cysteine S-methyltransferase